MDPLGVGAVIWLLDQSRAAVFNGAKNALLKGMGLIPPSPPTRGDMQSLLDQYVQRLEREIEKVNATLGQDRLALLKGALAQVKTAHRTHARDNFLAHALNSFHTITNLPQQGMTGTWRNAELRCIAFLGMAAAHAELHDSPQLIAENLIAAVQADSATAEEWLGASVVEVILRNHPSLSPQIASPFPPTWGHLQLDSSVEQIFPDQKVNSGSLTYDKQTRTYTLTRNIQGICRIYLKERDWRHDRNIFTDFALRVELIFPYSRTVRGGVLFRATSNPFTEKYTLPDRSLLESYCFSVCTDGRYALDFIRQTWKEKGIFTVREEEVDVKTIPLAQGIISLTVGTPLEIGVVARGSDLNVYANTQPLAQVKDNLRSNGRVGIAAGDWEYAHPSEVQFRNLQIWIP